MTRTQMFPPAPPKVTDLVIRQKTEAMIEYAYIALRQFPQHERHVLSAEIRRPPRAWRPPPACGRHLSHPLPAPPAP